MDTNESSFLFIGNNLAIDFVNTQVIDQNGEIELLGNLNDVRKWAKDIDIAIDSKANDETLPEILIFRQALRDCFTATIENRKINKKDIEVINRYLLFNDTEQRLELKQQQLTLSAPPKRPSLKKVLGKIAYEAAILLVSDKIKQLKHCANDKCVLLFLDISKTKKRRWCSMNTCGNRAKAANHYINSKIK